MRVWDSEVYSETLWETATKLLSIETLKTAPAVGSWQCPLCSQGFCSKHLL